MDIFLDMTGTITSLESEKHAFYKMCEAIKKKFNIEMDAQALMDHILEFRRPYMERRDELYYPIRNLIVKAVESVVPKRLCANEAFWIIDAYSNYHAKYVKMVDGGLESLKELRDIAEHMGLITDADRPYTERVLHALGIFNMFDSITTAEDAGVGKPNPKIFQMALRNSKSQRKFYIGDSEKRDIVGAKNVGMITIKVGAPSNIADYNVGTLKNSVHILKNLTQ